MASSAPDHLRTPALISNRPCYEGIKSCVRFKSLQDLPIGLIGEVIARTPVSKFIERYEASRHKTNTQG